MFCPEKITIQTASQAFENAAVQFDFFQLTHHDDLFI